MTLQGIFADYTHCLACKVRVGGINEFPTLLVIFQAPCTSPLRKFPLSTHPHPIVKAGCFAGMGFNSCPLCAQAYWILLFPLQHPYRDGHLMHKP